MKKVPCSYKGCGNRRIHHEKPDVMRPHQMVEVPENHTGPAYCSLECAAYDGLLTPSDVKNNFNSNITPKDLIDE